jgi:signal transduction histidine kinase
LNLFGNSMEAVPSGGTLTISYGIIEGHGGKISVESRPGD